ncbi:hypothetical protein JCM10599A_04540 [Paraburkholderia kururiensis]
MSGAVRGIAAQVRCAIGAAVVCFARRIFRQSVRLQGGVKFPTGGRSACLHGKAGKPASAR